jgi:hypothetical protein
MVTLFYAFYANETQPLQWQKMLPATLLSEMFLRGNARARFRQLFRDLGGHIVMLAIKLKCK